MYKSVHNEIRYNYSVIAEMAGHEDYKQAAFPLTAADLWREMENRAFIIPTGCDQ